MPVVSTGGSTCLVYFIDDATQFNHIYAIKAKSQVFLCFVKFLNTVEKFHGSSIKVLKSDRGGEYISNEFVSYLDNEGIGMKELRLRYQKTTLHLKDSTTCFSKE